MSGDESALQSLDLITDPDDLVNGSQDANIINKKRKRKITIKKAFSDKAETKEFGQHI